MRLWAGLLVLVMVMALSLAACSSNSGGGASKGEAAAAPAPETDADWGGGDPGRSYLTKDDGYVVGESPPQSSGMSPMEESEVAYDTADGSAGAGYAGNPGDVQSGRKITFRADMSINTKSFDADYRAINEMVKAAGGYVSNESMRDDTMSGRLTGRYTYMSAKIPAEGYDSFLDRLSEVGDVTSKNKSSDDLTSLYFDTEARIEMLEIRKERLMNYLVEAEEAADIVEFERELSNVLYELDQYQGDKRHLDQLVEFATIDINLTELITPETIGKDGEPLGDRASEAFAFSASGVGKFLEGVAVFFAGAAPVIALLAVIGLIIWAIVRLVRWLQEKYRQSRWGEARQKRIDEAARRRAERMAARQKPPRYQQPLAYQQQMQQQQMQPAYQYMMQQQPQTAGQTGQAQAGQAGQAQAGQAGQAQTPAAGQAEQAQNPETETPEPSAPQDPPAK